jgi:peptidyl-tRNA hydrolase
MLCCNEYILGDCTEEDLKIFHEIIKTTSKCLQDLLSKGCNRQLTVDNWIVTTHTKICGGAT